jgi:hypothetical protein
MAPGGPLAGNALPARRTPLRARRPAGRSRRPPGEFTPRVKLLVRARAGRGDPCEAVCESCGVFLGIGGGEFQRRAARGAGGSRDSVINGAANCVLLCPSCHRRAETRDREMGTGAQGFWIGHGSTPEFDPRLVPVLLYANGSSGIPVWLPEDGGEYLYERPEGIAA